MLDRFGPQPDSPHYTASEKDLIRKQLTVGNAEMRAAVQKRGYARHRKLAGKQAATAA
jgi:hypothetical protein